MGNLWEDLRETLGLFNIRPLAKEGETFNGPQKKIAHNPLFGEGPGSYVAHPTTLKTGI